MNARELSRGWDVCIVHDPQPAAIRALAPEKARAWVWRCHIDVSTPNPETMEQLLPYVLGLRRVAVPRRRATCRPGMNGGVNVVPPAIDPLTPKNMALSHDDAVYVCRQFGIDVNRPMICQVSRFDPWKDPQGVIDAYRIVKAERPDVQLALVGSMASDDPEGWDFYNATIAHADGDPDVHILNNFNNVGAIEVNAFQSLADVVIQKSTREGFGLTVSEALWKGRPFIGGDVGGIPLQVANGVSGYLVGSVEECAARALDIVNDPALGKALGRRGKEHVRAHFLTPRYLRDYLRIFHEVLCMSDAAAAGAGLQPRPGDLPGGRLGQARDRRAGDGPDRPRVAPRRDLDRVGDDRPGRRRRARARRQAVRGRGARGRLVPGPLRASPTTTPTTASTTSSPTRCSGSSSTTSGT